MAPLATNVQRSCRTREPKLIGYAVAAEAIIYDGAMVAVDPADGLAIPAADAAGLVVVGCAQRGFDNTGGLDGELGLTPARHCTVDQGEYSYATTGTPMAGATAYVVDDNTVGSATGTNSIVAGIFTEADPFTAGKWFVDHSKAQ